MKKVVICTIALAFVTFLGCESESVNSNIDSSRTQTNFNKGAKTGNSVYISSNTSGEINIFSMDGNAWNYSQKTLYVPYADADGVVYDGNRDALYHVNRSDNKLVAYDDISYRNNGDMLTPSAMGSSNFSQGREATWYNNKVVVADDVSPGKLVSYNANTNQINDYRSYQTDIELWGIQSTGKDLWAIVDASNRLAYYENFHNAPSGNLATTMEVGIEGLVRTHGLNYNEMYDIMVLTDIGAASGTDTAGTDGALVIIENFKHKFMMAGNNGTISLDDQIRIEGDLTHLGNPVDVAISPENGIILVAERAQQKFLVFEMPNENCNCTPVYSMDVAGASAVEIDF